MSVPVMANAKESPCADVTTPIRCALVEPTRAQKHKQELVRYALVFVAMMAVFLLIVIALYYTGGKSVRVKHVSSLVPYLSRTHLS